MYSFSRNPISTHTAHTAWRTLHRDEYRQDDESTCPYNPTNKCILFIWASSTRSHTTFSMSHVYFRSSGRFVYSFLAPISHSCECVRSCEAVIWLSVHQRFTQIFRTKWMSVCYVCHSPADLGCIFKLNERYVVDKLIGWLHYFILNVQIIQIYEMECMTRGMW